MSRTINRVELLGRVGSDPELRQTQGGTAVVQLRLATERRRDNGNDETDWHTVVCWAKQAEAVAEYVRKGERVYVAGRLQAAELEDRRGRAPQPERSPRPRGDLPRLRQRQRPQRR